MLLLTSGKKIYGTSNSVQEGTSARVNSATNVQQLWLLTKFQNLLPRRVAKAVTPSFNLQLLFLSGCKTQYRSRQCKCPVYQEALQYVRGEHFQE